MPASCSDIERSQVSVPKGTVCWPIHRNRVGLEHTARWSKDVDHGARSGLAPSRAGDDVALRVQAHAIDTSLHPTGILSKGMQHAIGSERIVVAQRVGP